jgi:hypothetical protein
MVQAISTSIKGDLHTVIRLEPVEVDVLTARHQGLEQVEWSINDIQELELTLEYRCKAP